MDIRNYFGRSSQQATANSTHEGNNNEKATKTKKHKKAIVLESSDEEEKPKHKKKVITLDSDDDEFEPSVKKRKVDNKESVKGKKLKASPESGKKSSSINDKEKKKVKIQEEEKKKQPISVSDFFGTAAVKQSDKRTVAVIEKKPPTVEQPKSSIGKAEPHVETSVANTNIDEEILFDDDEAFEQTLAQLDAQDEGLLNIVATATSSQVTFDSKLSALVAVKETSEQLGSQSFEIEQDSPPVVSNEKPKKTRTSPRKRPIEFIDSSPEKSSKAANKTRQLDSNITKVEILPKKLVTTKPPVTQSQDLNDSIRSEGDSTKEEKRGNLSFRSYLNREGPRALGSKDIPKGNDNSLEGLTFVLTGVLESIERDDAKSLIERLGGKVTTSLSKKTSYMVVGRDAGESKTNKAQTFGTKLLDEEGLFDLIRRLPPKKSKYEVAAEKDVSAMKVICNQAKDLTAGQGKGYGGSKVIQAIQASSQASLPSDIQIDSQSDSQISSASGSQFELAAGTDISASLMWVDKYKPKTVKQIIGQHTDKSNAKKLSSWLANWHSNLATGKKPAFKGAGDDGSGYRAALLSGPPGVGKTTTAQVVCAELGFSYVELNASDTRSQKSLKEHVAQALGCHTLMDYCGELAGMTHKLQGQKHCLLMDEVDGMAGNEDRGGVQELIQLIKHSRIPIICMCNDRQHPKIRSLSFHCFDLRFQRPRLEQIKSAMMSIAFKESIKLPPAALNEIIAASNQDVRQCLHNLQLWTSSNRAPTYEDLKKEAGKVQKDLKVGPFDVCRQVFAIDTQKLSLNDKADLFFQDYSLGPLFVQENYLHVHPASAGGNPTKHMQLLSQAADSLATGDLIDRVIRSQNNWQLLPLQAIFSSVIPGDVMRGYMGGQINFPSWLGKNSTTNKNDRMLQELRNHMILSLSGDKRSLAMDYLPAMRHTLTQPLVLQGADGVPQVVGIMEAYDLLREDLDNILEVTQWPNNGNPMKNIDPKVKAALTRAYTKECHLLPYSLNQGVKKGRAQPIDTGLEDGEEALLGEDTEQNEEAEEEGDDVAADAMIKAKKTTASKSTKGKASSNAKVKEPAKTSKGKEPAKTSKGKEPAKTSKGKEPAKKQKSTPAQKGKKG